MGKGRAPCCDKTKVKRGPWSQEEDMKLITFINKFGHENWRSLPKQSGLMRCGKSCRLRWINYLRPDVKRGNFTVEEEKTIIKLHQNFGNKWSKIASQLPGRTDNEIKNVWHTHLKKRLTQTSGTDLTLDDHASPCSSGKEDKSQAEDTLTNQESTLSSSGTNHSNQQEDPLTSLTFGNFEAYNEFNDEHNPLEIPFDSNLDIWSFLDDSNSFEQPHENNMTSRVEDEDEVQKWFKHLESELGLEEEDDDNQHHKQGTQDNEQLSSSSSKIYELMIH